MRVAAIELALRGTSLMTMPWAPYIVWLELQGAAQLIFSLVDIQPRFSPVGTCETLQRQC